MKPRGTFDEVMELERSFTDAWRLTSGRDGSLPLTGLALSGGGIRSAVFCLGVLQALAKHGLLARFDYLSTVSGGGFIGSAVTWFTSKHPDAFGVSAQTFPFGTDDPTTRRSAAPRITTDLLRHLRRHSSYLIPGDGIGWLSGIGVVLRGIVLNILLVWLPLVTAVLALLRAAVRALTPTLPGLFPALAVLIVFTGWTVLYSIQTYVAWRRDPMNGLRYPARRAFEVNVPTLLWLGLGLGLLGSLQPVSALLPGSDWLGGIMTAAGTLGGLLARFKPNKPGGGALPAWIAPLAAGLVLYGVALLAYGLATPLARWGGVWTWLVPAGIGLLALLIGWFVDLNHLTLHRYYRDRLMEAFMPDLRGQTPTGFTAGQADRGYLKDVCDPERPAAPYHLINAHLVLTKFTPAELNTPAGRKRFIRGGDSFVLSRFACGSRATGWLPAHQFMGGSLSLPSAMAISGAAVNPDAASAGMGPQRSTLFATLMSLLNIRLGYWVPNPHRRRPPGPPNHFNPGVFAALDRLALDDTFLELTDGGHFENLGVYELLRRGVRTIVVCDATQDAAYAFADLQNLLSRAESDFGVSVEFTQPGRLDPLMPWPPSGPSFPDGVPLSQQPFVEGRIAYPDGTEGALIYIKPALYPDLRLQVLGYKGAFPNFPDDSTLDQFFNEARFEAYRELGFASVEQMLAKTTVPLQAM